MPKFRLNKLVRDNLLEKYFELGQKPDYTQLAKQEHAVALVDKAIEEIRELVAAPEAARASELADVQEVLDSLKRLYQVSGEQVMAAQAAKRAKSGSFDRGIFIKSLDLEDGDEEWIAYYRKEPERHPEVL